jgi:hypothetical protein
MQKKIALLTAEAEKYSASKIAVEIIYLRNLIRNMGLPQEDDTPVYEDNTACIEWGNHITDGRERAKQIDIRKHFAHEVIQNHHMRFIRALTDEQLLSSLPRCYHFLSLNDAEWDSRVEI